MDCRSLKQNNALAEAQGALENVGYGQIDSPDV